MLKKKELIECPINILKVSDFKKTLDLGLTGLEVPTLYLIKFRIYKEL